MPPAAVHYDTIGTPSHNPGQLPSKVAQSVITVKEETNNATNYEDDDLLDSSDEEWTAMVDQWRKRDFRAEGEEERQETNVAPNKAINYEIDDILESSDEEWTALVEQWRKRDFRAEAKKQRRETRARRLEERREDARELHRIEMDGVFTRAWGLKKRP
jgi:hypothetical protein